MNRRMVEPRGNTMTSDRDNSGERAETIEQKIDTLSASFDLRFDTVDERFATLSASVDERFNAVDVALMEQRQYTEFAFDRVETRFNTLESRFDTVESRFDRLERKLDQFIDTQMTTNKLVERRLTALEPRSAEE